MANNELFFIPSTRNGTNLVMNDYIFHLAQKLKNGNTYWVCKNYRSYSTKCPARVRLSNNNVVLERHGEHNHDKPALDKIKRYIDTLNESVAPDSTTSTPKLYEKAVKSTATSFEEASRIPSYDSIKKKLYKARKFPSSFNQSSEFFQVQSSTCSSSVQEEPNTKPSAAVGHDPDSTELITPDLPQEPIAETSSSFIKQETSMDMDSSEAEPSENVKVTRTCNVCLECSGIPEEKKYFDKLKRKRLSALNISMSSESSSMGEESSSTSHSSSTTRESSSIKNEDHPMSQAISFGPNELINIRQVSGGTSHSSSSTTRESSSTKYEEHPMSQAISFGPNELLNIRHVSGGTLLTPHERHFMPHQRPVLPHERFSGYPTPYAGYPTAYAGYPTPPDRFNMPHARFPTSYERFPMAHANFHMAHEAFPVTQGLDEFTNSQLAITIPKPGEPSKLLSGNVENLEDSPQNSPTLSGSNHSLPPAYIERFQTSGIDPQCSLVSYLQELKNLSASPSTYIEKEDNCVSTSSASCRTENLSSVNSLNSSQKGNDSCSTNDIPSLPLTIKSKQRPENTDNVSDSD